MSFGNALAVDLSSGTGLSTQASELIGASALTTLAGVGTAQSGGKAIPKWTTNVLATTSAGQTALVLPSDAPLEVVYMVTNSTSTAALVFPPSGGSINAASQDASVSIAQNLARLFIRKSTTRWVSFLAA